MFTLFINSKTMGKYISRLICDHYKILSLFRPLIYTFGSLVFIIIISFSTLFAGFINAKENITSNECKSFLLYAIHIQLDGSDLDICSPISFKGSYIANSDDLDQSAYFAEYNPYRQLSIKSIPFGLTSPTEEIEKSDSNQTESILEKLTTIRNHDGGEIEKGININAFNKKIKGIVSYLKVNLDSSNPTPVIMSEWTVEAGKRNWIIRLIIQPLNSDKSQKLKDPYLKLFNSFSINSKNINNESSILRSIKTKSNSKVQVTPSLPEPKPIVAARPNVNTALPSWWNNKVCDTDRYANSVRLSNSPSLYGVFPCGPFDSNSHTLTVATYNTSVLKIGNTIEEEWQCAELSKRFMYMVYGERFYSANGNQIVSNYTGTILRKNYPTDRISPKVGDVIAMDSTTPGHTGVVIESTFNSSGNGTVVMMEQNSSSDGKRTITFSNFYDVAGRVTGWLHDPSSDIAVPDTGDGNIYGFGQNADGRLEYFTRNKNNQLINMYQQAPNSSWTLWGTVSSLTISSYPAVGKNSDGRLEVFVRGADGTLYHMYQQSLNGNWSGLSPMDGKISGNPVVGQNADGRLEVFALGDGNTLVHFYQQVGGGWSSSSVLGYNVNSDPAVALNSNGIQSVIVVAQDNAIYRMDQTVPNGGWSGWNNMFGWLTGNPVIGKNADGRLEIIARDTENNLAHVYQNYPGGTWSSWSLLTYDVRGNPNVYNNADGRLEIFVKDRNNNMSHIYQNPGGGWSPLVNTGLIAVGNASIGKNKDGRLEVYVKGSNNMYGSYQQYPNGGWSGWGNMYGNVY